VVTLVAVGGAALGAAIGLAASTGIGPFAADPVPPVFDPDVYRRATVVIGIESIDATSVLPPSGSASYQPGFMIDADTSTAWNSLGDARQDGVGEQVFVDLAAPAWVTSVRVANGDQRDTTRFLANARLARVVARFDDGSEVVLVLLDEPGEQEVALPQPVLTSRVTFEVLEAHRGDTSRDLAVSELTVLGHVALGADRVWQEDVDTRRDP